MENQEKDPQNPTLERITMRMIYQSILEALNLEKGFLYTIYSFAVRPGQATNEYLYQNRKKLVPPLRFLIITVTIATVLTLSLISEETYSEMFYQGFESGSSEDLQNLSPEMQEMAELYLHNMVSLMRKFFNVFLMFSVPIAALASALIYRFKKYNFAEHLVINAFIYGNTTVLYALMIPLVFFFSYQDVSFWYLLAAFPYYCYCCYQIFKPKGIPAILRALFSYILQGIFVMVFMTVIAIAIGSITAAYGIKI